MPSSSTFLKQKYPLCLYPLASLPVVSLVPPARSPHQGLLVAFSWVLHTITFELSLSEVSPNDLSAVKASVAEAVPPEKS